MGHRRGAALPEPLPRLAHLGLGEQGDVVSDLRAGTCLKRELGPELGDDRTIRVPGKHRLCKLELDREEGRNPRALCAQRGESARCSAQLCRKPTAQLSQPDQRARNWHQPSGSLETERRGDGLLQKRPGSHRRQPVCLGEPGARGSNPSSSSRISPSARRETSIAALSTMSWLVAPSCAWSAASPPTISRSARARGSAGPHPRPLR